MIEINLLPGKDGGRRAGNRHRAIRRFPALARLDAWLLGSTVIVLGSVGLSLHLVRASAALVPTMEAQLQESLADSAQTAVAALAHEEADRIRDSLSVRILRIEGLDRGRYRWPHLLDEISRALPGGIRINAISEVIPVPRPAIQGISPEAGAKGPHAVPPTRFRVEGIALDNFTLTQYWNRLEASFFIRDVNLVNTEAVQVTGSADPASTRYRFVLEADSEEAPPEVINLQSPGRVVR